MKRIFLDTNVLIDLLAKRKGYEVAALLLSLSLKQDFSLHVSVLTMANIVYILRKVLKGDDMYHELGKLSNKLAVESITKQNYELALRLKAHDFEDSLQYFCAKSSACDVIITRNGKDFPFSDIRVMTPEEYLSSL